MDRQRKAEDDKIALEVTEYFLTVFPVDSYEKMMSF